MALSNRDKWLAAVLPAVMAFSIYQYFPGATAAAKLKRARADLATEQALKPAPTAELRAALAEAGRVQDALEDANALSAKLAAKVALNPGNSRGAIDRGEPLRFISNALAKRGLFLVKSERIESGAKSAIPRGIQDAWKKLPEANRPREAQVWRFEIHGAFTPLHQVIHELEKASAFIVPLSVSMEPFSKEDLAKEPGLKKYFKWTLTVWL